MQQYEFCQIHQDYDRLSHPWTLTTFTPNGLTHVESHRDKAMGDRSDYDAARRKVAELGMDGWQLVAWASGYYFQRPIP